MKKNMEENKGGLSIFSTDFASKGLSWAGNLYHKWENIGLDDIIVQDPSKFVDVVNEQFRKICKEVADDLLNPFSDGCVKGPVSDLSLEEDAIGDICNISKTGHAESPKNEGPFITFPSEKEACFTSLPVLEQDERKEACKILSKKISMAPAEVKGHSCPNEIREDCENVLSDFVNHPGPQLSADGVLLSEFPVNMVERGFLLSHCTIPTEENGTSPSVEAVSLIQSVANAYEQKCSSSEPEMHLSLTEIADTYMEEHGEFEHVKLEDLFEGKTQVDYWGDAEKYKPALIPQQANKNQSYKKKLRDVFHSKFYSSKKKSNSQGAGFDGAIDVDLLKRVRTTASSVSSRGSENRDLSTAQSAESEWELL